MSAAIFDSGLVEALARSGLIHLLAISGLHVGLLLALARGLLCLTGASPGTCRVAEIALLILLVELVAARPPVLRAATMGLIHVGSASLGRRSPLLGSLAVAVLLLTLPDPYVVRDLGFQLSLAAVTGILLIVPRLMATLGPTTPRWLALPAALAVTTLAAQLSVAPLLAATSHRISVAALVLNLAAVPTMTVAMSTCVAAVLFHGMGLSSLAGAFATATTTLFELLATLAGTAESWSWSSVPIERVTAPVVGLYYVGLLASLLDVRGSVRRLGLAACATALAVMIWPISTQAMTGTTRLRTLDVGQGDALAVQRGHSAILIDAGGYPGLQYDTGANIVAPALRAVGIRRLEAIATSHPHLDHAAGLPAIMREMPTGCLWLGPAPGLPSIVGTLLFTAGERRIPALCPRLGADFEAIGCRWGSSALRTNRHSRRPPLAPRSTMRRWYSSSIAAATH